MSDNPEKSNRVELRNPDDTVFARGTYKPEFSVPRFFPFVDTAGVVDNTRAWIIDETSWGPQPPYGFADGGGGPLIFRLGRAGVFVPDPSEDPDA